MYRIHLRGALSHFECGLDKRIKHENVEDGNAQWMHLYVCWYLTFLFDDAIIEKQRYVVMSCTMFFI